MNNTATSESYQVSGHSLPLRDKLAKKLVLNILRKITYGSITLHDKNESLSFGCSNGPSVAIHIKDASVYRRVLFGGSIGAGESYVEGLWTIDNLTDLVRIMVRNMEILDRMEQGLAWLLMPARLAGHIMNRNNKHGSRRNISSHYDLGNEMYASFLDPSMMYSSAIFPNEETDLDAASRFKLDQICEKLGIKSGDSVLEIGTGWGGFAIHAAKNYGCHVTTTTISRAQFEEAQRRVNEAGLTDRITLLQKDYRDLQGKYDKLVSIEMIEAVGDSFLPGFFRKCGELLKNNGAMLLQAITIRDQKYKQYLRGVDFIQRHIFPGGCVVSNSRMIELLTTQTDMVVRLLEDFGHDYARTLNEWKKNFLHAFPALMKHGYDEKFKRLWEFYLAYCEGGFREQSISVVHLVASRPENRSRFYPR